VKESRPNLRLWARDSRGRGDYDNYFYNEGEKDSGDSPGEKRNMAAEKRGIRWWHSLRGRKSRRPRRDHPLHEEKSFLGTLRKKRETASQGGGKKGRRQSGAQKGRAE